MEVARLSASFFPILKMRWTGRRFCIKEATHGGLLLETGPSSPMADIALIE